MNSSYAKLAGGGDGECLKGGDLDLECDRLRLLLSRPLRYDLLLGLLERERDLERERGDLERRLFRCKYDDELDEDGGGVGDLLL